MLCLLEKEGHPFTTGLSLVQSSKHTPGIGIRLEKSFACDHHCSFSNTWGKKEKNKQTRKMPEAESLYKAG